MTPGYFLKCICFLGIWIYPTKQTCSQSMLLPANSKTGLPVMVDSARPLDLLSVTAVAGKHLMVKDGEGKIYVDVYPKHAVFNFRVGGTIGTHSVIVGNKGAEKKLADFYVDAKTNINDNGYYKQMFDLFYNTMCYYNKNGEDSIEWNGKIYHYFVSWILDDNNTLKGMKYFNSHVTEFIDLMRDAQREDGMIWSYIHHSGTQDYFLTRDKYTGYTKKIGNRFFTRQPTENHPEYNYVNAIYQCWKANGDDTWMKQTISSAARALDYALQDPARWSKRFQLLKRVYTIDSWDFAVEDEYMPDIGITNSMIIDPVKSKFGIFFGDNTGYSKACKELSEMYRHAGMISEADRYARRGMEIENRLNDLSWNGHFFRHFIDEDSTVIRKLGVDESKQVAQSNAYSLNRDIRPDQQKAIIETYLDLRDHLPVGSPGEWYSIYPPFQRGFETHNVIWQYMNGGVGGHVAGELALGAFQAGYEDYGTDILNRLFELGKKFGNRVLFAYAGSIPAPPPPPVYKPVDLQPFANMDHFDQGGPGVFSWMNSKRKGDDLRQLPVGEQNLRGIRFHIIDPALNNRKSVVAVSKQKGFPDSVSIPVNDTASSIYLLHTSTKPSSEGVCGSVTFVYDDGSRKVNYIIMGKQLTYWWFSELNTDHSGIAWYGKNEVSEGVGLSWCAIDNPYSHKKISKILLQSPADNGIYTVLGLSLSNQKHYVPVDLPSFGGPDNWAGAIAMSALVEGLAGVTNAQGAQAFSVATIAPRWSTTSADSVNVCIRYPAAKGYVSYQYAQDKNKRIISLWLTGSGSGLKPHILLPDHVETVKKVSIDGKAAVYVINKSGNSHYVDMELLNVKPVKLVIEY